MYSSEARYQKVHRAFDERNNVSESSLILATSDDSSIILTTTRKKIPYVIVAIPAFNEEIAIGSMVLRSRDYADKVLVIDDGSTDRTLEIALRAGADVISHAKNQGKGSAICDAFACAKKANADILILMDGDGQHNPDEIPSLIGPIISGDADMVNGSRFLAGSISHVPAYRRLGQEVLTIATNAGLNMRITDTQNGFRAFSKKTFECFSFRQKGMAIESEMLMDAASVDTRIVEVPVNVRYDVEHASTYNPVSHGFNVLGHVISLVSRQKPLLFYCAPGLLLAIVGLVAAILMLNSFNMTHSLSAGYLLMTTFGVTMGAFCIFTGLILSAIQGIGMR